MPTLGKKKKNPWRVSFSGKTFKQCWRVNSVQPQNPVPMLSQLQALSLWHLQFLSLSKCCSHNYARYANYPLIKGMITIPLCQFWFLQKALKRCSHRNKWLLSTPSFTRTMVFSPSAQTEGKTSPFLGWFPGRWKAGEPWSSITSKPVSILLGLFWWITGLAGRFEQLGLVFRASFLAI